MKPPILDPTTLQVGQRVRLVNNDLMRLFYLNSLQPPRFAFLPMPSYRKVEFSEIRSLNVFQYGADGIWNCPGCSVFDIEEILPFTPLDEEWQIAIWLYRNTGENDGV